MHGAGSAFAGGELADSIRAHPVAAAYALQWVTATVTSERNISHPLFAHTVQQLSAVVGAVVQAQPLLLLEGLSVWQVQRALLQTTV
jgi:pantothenate kinase